MRFGDDTRPPSPEGEEVPRVSTNVLAHGSREAAVKEVREKERERGTTYGKMKKSAVVTSRTVHANVAGKYLVFTSHFGILHAPLFRWHTISASH